MSVTIIDISKATGKSYQTVSKALNDDPKISLKTRQLIHDVATRMGYIRNRAARELKNGQNKVICVSIPAPSGYFYAELAASLHKAISAHGYSPMFSFWSNDDEQEAAVRNALSWNPIGMITNEPRHIPQYCPIPVVSYNRTDPRFDCVIFDQETATRKLVDLLFDYGHRSVAWIGNDGDWQISYLISFCKMRGIHFESIMEDEMPLFPIFNHTEYLLDKLLEKYKDKKYPTAIVTLRDTLAFAIISRMRTLGLKCPDDISVIGADDLIINPYFIPSVTTFQRGCSTEDIGVCLVHKMLQRIHEPEAPTEIVKMPVNLIMRNSLSRAKI